MLSEKRKKKSSAFFFNSVRYNFVNLLFVYLKHGSTMLVYVDATCTHLNGCAASSQCVCAAVPVAHKYHLQRKARMNENMLDGSGYNLISSCLSLIYQGKIQTNQLKGYLSCTDVFREKDCDEVNKAV